MKIIMICTVDSRVEECNIVVIGEASTRESVPQVTDFWEDAI